jgi:DNA replication protein DnaC
LKSFDDFDFKYQHSITKRMITEWKDFTWIDNRENKILMGPPGVGKTHISIALGYEAILKGYKVIFYNMNDLIDEMIIANVENNFKKWISKLVKNDLITNLSDMN